ncbi:hypothetical protein HNR60_002580 [Rhodopseudomonas rhenobacensis]|uniref:Uncharacterized protein n=1 Tax=Rhodopseudomonas rhenobacensis TaxID=87461 RepID=A0A7W8DZB0_9BRAD|nr:hypothetical protein [Rhodopseudomonas rhenobacensis]MBB5047823.1 hypothetical protein [Rhodopseudomonas rhenobacensis]
MPRFAVPRHLLPHQVLSRQVLSRLLLLLALAVPLAQPSHAADLAGHSRLGAVFAEPVAPRRYAEPVVIAAQPLQVGPLSLPGYYGRLDSFQYNNYYGTSLIDIYGRLPYSCGLVGYCR